MKKPIIPANDDTSRLYKELVEVLAKRGVAPAPEWVAGRELPKKCPGTPVLFVSDIHAGEVVKPDEVMGLNKYNWKIMEARLERVFKTAAELLKEHLAHTLYPGIVVVLGGDIVSGDIHDELKETNEKSVYDSIIPMATLLAGHIRGLRKVFKKVRVVGVAGNHGRNTRRPRAKGYVENNADFLIYQLIAKFLSDDPAITCEFPKSRDFNFVVAGRRFRLTHGDQFRGGDGMVGALGPIIRGDAKKRVSAMQMGRPEMLYDTILVAHFHQTVNLPHVIVNGSVKGTDEYSMGENFRFEEPSQTLFTVHPKYGINWIMPIKC